jgi:hypothetical protein
MKRFQCFGGAFWWPVKKRFPINALVHYNSDVEVVVDQSLLQMNQGLNVGRGYKNNPRNRVQNAFVNTI